MSATPPTGTFRYSAPDHLLITNLIHRYAELVDSGDFDGLGALFAHGELHATDGPVRGADAVREHFASWVQLHDDGSPHTRHVTTNVIVEVADDAQTARARSYVTVLQYGPGGMLRPIFFVRYFDRFHRVDGEWAFASRRYVEPAAGPAEEHLKRDYRRSD